MYVWVCANDWSDVDIIVCIHMQGATNLETIVQDKKQAEPFVIITGDLSCPDQAFLVVDCVIIGTVDITKIPLALLSAYFVFNICYVKGCTNVFSFLEVLLLNASVDKVTTAVKHFLTALQNV